MKNWLLTTWDLVRTSLWLIPSLMVVAGILLAIIMLEVDTGFGTEDTVKAWWMNDGDGEDARNLLSTLLTSTITMASLAFSITAVALTLAANAYGSRLIRVFRADLKTQVVLGTFAMTIVYCLLVLRSITGSAPPHEVPHASVSVGSGLGLTCVFALLAFIQGVAKSITADEVIRRVRAELDGIITTLPLLGSPKASIQTEDFGSDAQPISLPREGYVQAVDYDEIVAWAAARRCKVRLDFKPGDFVVEGDQRVFIAPRTNDPAKAKRELSRWIISGEERTPTQDIDFAVRHLVEVAVRALSPGVNDPFTALAVIDRLRGGISRLMARELPAPTLKDKARVTRVWREVPTFEEILGAAFDQLRQAGAAHPAVIAYLLEALARMADHVRSADQRVAILKQAQLARDAAERERPESAAVEEVERSYRRVIASHDLQTTASDQS